MAKGIKALVLVTVLAGVVSVTVMMLWNALVPDIFHGPRIGFWQAAGLLVLSRILVGSWRGRGGPGHWRQRRWARMTPEERERLRAKMGCFGGRSTPAGGGDPAGSRDPR